MEGDLQGLARMAYGSYRSLVRQQGRLAVPGWESLSRQERVAWLAAVTTLVGVLRHEEDADGEADVGAGGESAGAAGGG